MGETLESLLGAIEDDDLDDRKISACSVLLRCAKEIGFVEQDAHGGLWVSRRGDAFLRRRRKGQVLR